jgi:amidase
MTEILCLSAIEQARLIREREISATELIGAHLDRIAEVNPAINAAIDIFADRAKAEATFADRSPSAGRLHGVPFSVKDSIEIAGTVCTAGTVGRRNAAVSEKDATLVARLRNAGAIPIAKTNLPDSLFAFETDNLLFGRTNNPYDISRSAGGSSGGEAALIAACASPMGLGSDCAGSVRLPAAFCGVAAIKPTSGRLPRTGHFPPPSGWIEALWQIGPMARSVADLRLMMRVLAGADGPERMGSYNEEVRDLRIAFYTDSGLVETNDETVNIVRSAGQALGADEDRPACIAGAYDLEMKLLGADGGDSIRAYLREIGSARLHSLLEAWLEKLEPYRTDLAGFQNYWAEWDRYRAGMNAFFEKYDVLVCPVYTQPALPHGASILDSNFRGFSHTMAYNLAGLPAATVRCGESLEGLPIGVQVVARKWREEVALSVAERLEQTFGGWKAPLKFSATAAG